MATTEGPLIDEAGTPRVADDHQPKRFADTAVVTSPSGLIVPKIGLGTWQLDDDQARRAVSTALEAGYRHIDTAQMYGNEAGVGAGIAEAGVPRRDIFLTTKIDNANHEPDDLVASLERSLDRLRTDHVDLLLIHWPTDWQRIGATMATMAQVQAGGLARHLGVSNFTIDQLEDVQPMAPVEVLQAECHPFFQQRDLREWCVDHGWLFTAYSPLAQGDVVDDDTLHGIARDHGVSAAAVALRWLTTLDATVAIPRSTDPDHIEANFAALGVDLRRNEIAAIEGLEAGRRLVDPDFAPW